MKSLRRMMLMTAVAMAAGLFATTGRANADWNLGDHHVDSNHCIQLGDHHHDDCDRGHEAKSVPEIDPSGLTAMGTVLAGGIALISSRRRRIIK